MNHTAIFPGTFDPLTFGHVDLVHRALQLFDKVIIAMTAGTGKSPAFTATERLSLAQLVFADSPKVQALTFSGLLVDFMQENDIRFVLRGIRTLADVEYEFQLATMNGLMKPGIETVFLQTAPQYAHISSTIVREIAAKSNPKSLGDLSLFVPPPVVEAFVKKQGG